MRTILALMLLCCLVGAAEPLRSSLLFEQFARGEFFEDTRFQIVPGVGRVPLLQMGPDVELEKGKLVHCSVLEFQAVVVARHGGPGAFNAAFRHLDDHKLYMRWIAAQALIYITGKEPLWYWYGTPGKPFNGDENWSSRAKTEWLKWKAEQAGTGPPATRPESKSEGSDKSQPESEGRSR